MGAPPTGSSLGARNWPTARQRSASAPAATTRPTATSIRCGSARRSRISSDWIEETVSTPDGIKSAGTEEVSPGIMLDFDNQGRVIGIEVLDVSERMARSKAAG